MKKFKEWWYHEDKYVYINDEGDEIVTYSTNGEIILGIIGGLIGWAVIIAFVIIMSSVK